MLGTEFAPRITSVSGRRTGPRPVRLFRPANDNIFSPSYRSHSSVALKDKIGYKTLKKTHSFTPYKIFLPLRLAQRAARMIYTYKYPNIKLRNTRAVRHVVPKPVGRLVPVNVHIAMPKHARPPLVRPHYIRVTDRVRGSALPSPFYSYAVASMKQTARLFQRREANRVRYEEGKSNKRHWDHGQLASAGPSPVLSANMAGNARSIMRAATVSRAMGY